MGCETEDAIVVVTASVPTLPRQDIVDWILGAELPTAGLQFRGTSIILEAFFVDDEGFITYLPRGHNACSLKYCPTFDALWVVIGPGMALHSNESPPKCCTLL